MSSKKSYEKMIPISAKIPDELYEKLSEYKVAMGINSDSEAVRDILRRFLFELWKKPNSEANQNEGV